MTSDGDIENYWRVLIDRNREALLRIVETLFSIAGLDDRDTVETLPRFTRNYIHRILRPAESAARRLIAIATRRMQAPTLPPRGVRHVRRSLPNARSDSAGPGAAPSFPLVELLPRYDLPPRIRYATTVPRIRALGEAFVPVYLRVPEPEPRRLPMPDDRLDATQTCRRLKALRSALGDIDRQARRLLRWRARRDLGLNRRVQYTPIRRGRPPGRRRRATHEVHDILRDLHPLALRTLDELNTS